MVLLRSQGFHCCLMFCFPQTKVQKILTLLCYDFLYYDTGIDDFISLVSSCFCSDMNEVLCVPFHF